MFRLFYPLRYFQLQNDEKRLLDVIPTFVLALLLAAPFLLLPGAAFYRPNGFLDKVLALTSALTGFYVAALVAAATFSHPDLDKVIRSGSIALVSRGADGRKIQELLTRREFACAIFGYLAYAALLISLGAAIAISVSQFDTSSFASSWIAQKATYFLASKHWFCLIRSTGIILFTIAICPASGPLRQTGRIAERRISGSS